MKSLNNRRCKENARFLFQLIEAMVRGVTAYRSTLRSDDTDALEDTGNQSAKGAWSACKGGAGRTEARLARNRLNRFLGRWAAVNRPSTHQRPLEAQG